MAGQIIRGKTYTLFGENTSTSAYYRLIGEFHPNSIDLEELKKLIS